MTRGARQRQLRLLALYRMRAREALAKARLARAGGDAGALRSALVALRYWRGKVHSWARGMRTEQRR